MLQIRILPSYTFRASSQNIGPSWLAVLVQREMPASDRHRGNVDCHWPEQRCPGRVAAEQE